MTDQIFGLNLDHMECDRIWSLLGFKKEWSTFEVPLFGSKWFDYRLLHPVQATYLFAHKLTETYKRAYAENFDESRAAYVRGFTGSDVMMNSKPGVASGMWRARQHADAIGCPYEVYLQIVVDKLMRLNRSAMPFVTELYQGWVVEAAQIGWEERQAGRLYLAEHEAFRNQNYVGLGYQNAYHEWLFAQAGKRDSLPRWLGRFVFRDEILPAEKVIARYGHDMLESAREYS